MTTHASVIVVTNHVGHVLAVSRDGDCRDMALPGGHVEDGESYDDAAKRELLEETNVTAHVVEHLFDSSEAGDKTVHVYRAVATDAHSTTIKSEPNEFARFVDQRELTSAKSFGAWARTYADKLFTTPFAFDARGWREIAQRWSSVDPQRVSADLAPSSVHVDSLGGYRQQTEREKNPKLPDLSGVPTPGFMQPTPPRRDDVLPFPRWPLTDQRNMIDAAKRKSLPSDKFALPEKSAYPIDTAARVRNAAARLEQNKGGLSPADYKSAKSRIAAAAKRFGIHSEYNASDESPVAPHMHVSAVIPQGGHLHVRHLSDEKTQALTLDDDAGRGSYLQVVTLGDVTSDGPVWNQVACVGAFKGHPAGPFALTPDVFDEIVSNWERGGKKPIPVDFEHASEAEATAGSIPRDGAPAQAWIVDLQNRGGDGLFGLFDDWDPQARSYVRTKRYRFLSPAIRFGSKDKVTGRPIGARLTSAALTNQPFLDNLAPVRAKATAGLLAAKDAPMQTTQLVKMQSIAESDHATHSFITPPSDYMPKLKACMGMHPLSTSSEMKDNLDRIREHLNRAGGDVNAMVDGVSVASFMHPLRAMTYGDNAHAMTAGQILDAVERMVDHADGFSMATAIESDKGGAYPMATTAESDKGGTNEVSMATTAESDKQPSAGTAGFNDNDSGADMKTMSDLETEITTMKVTAADKDAKIKTLETQVVELTAWRTEREEADLSADVEFVLSAHAEKIETLGADDDERRTILLSFRKTDPATFERMYPKDADPTKAYLLRQVTPPAPRETAAALASETGIPELDAIFKNEESVDVTAERLCSEKKISFLDAAEEARKLHRLAEVYVNNQTA